MAQRWLNPVMFMSPLQITIYWSMMVMWLSKGDQRRIAFAPQSIRGFQEASMLLEHIGQHMQSAGDAKSARIFLAKARELNQRAGMFQKIAIGHEILSSENLEEQRPAD